MWRMEPILTTAKARYSLLIHAEDGTNSNDSKKRGILYLFMKRMEPTPTTEKSIVYSLLIHAEDRTNSSDSKKHGVLYLFIRRMEPIPTKAGAWYSLPIHVDDETKRQQKMRYSLLIFMFYGPNHIYFFNNEKSFLNITYMKKKTRT
jgi:hypothetical protein